ncbi:MMPL domain protein [Parafrankia sp. EAN1pec]|uniref:efflux RND transporter permease subunit n=1 Tax=Parafrankia sp. (strain EAN1pec) TaxID=298653 RepID=UPI0000542347|nr:MMPL domain protein [Frankia sp. EAN1pec]
MLDDAVTNSRRAGYWARVATVTSRRGGLVAALTGLVTVLLGFGMTRLEFTSGQDNYLDADSRVYQDNVEYQNLFGGQAMLSVFTIGEGKTLADLFTPKNVAQWNELQERLEADPRINSAITPVAALNFIHDLVNGDSGDLTSSPAARIALGARGRDPEPASAQLRLDDSIETLNRFSAVKDRSLTNPAWVNFLLYDNQREVRSGLRPFFPNGKNAQMIVRLTGNASMAEEGAAAKVVEDAMAGRTFDNATVVTTGAPVVLREIDDYLEGGFLTLSGIALALMAGLLLVAFAVRWRLLPLGVVVVGLIWAFGVAGYLSIPLSVMTIAGLPVLLGIGIDFAVQLHSRIEEETALDRVDHPLRETLTRLGPPLLVATVAGVLALLALQVSKVPMLRGFGALLAVGLPVVVLATVLISFTSLSWRERHAPTPAGDYTHGPLARIVLRLGALPRAAALPLTALSVVVLVGGFLAENQLTVQTDPERWVDQGSQVIRDVERVRELVDSTSELGVFVQARDVFSDETVEFVDGFARKQLAAHPGDLLTASTIVTATSSLLDIPGTAYVPPTGADVALTYSVAPPEIQASTVNQEAKALNIVFQQASGPLNEHAAVVNDIRDNVASPAGITATPSGLAVLGVALLDNFEASRAELTYYALGAVFVFLLLCHVNVARAVLSMAPVLTAVGLASVVAWAAGLELSPLTAVGGPLVVALCAEFTTLLIGRYVEERQRGHAAREAVDVAAARTGRAFMVSAMAAVIGVLVLALSPLPLLRDFGLVVALNVGIALVSALVVLPPLLVWVDDKGWVYRTRDAVTKTGSSQRMTLS